MRKFIKLIDQTLGFSLICAMSAILLTVIWQVISRFILKDPASVTEELSRFILIWVGILGSAYAYRKKSHLGFNLIVDRQTKATRRMLLTIVEVLVITFSALALIVGGKELVIITLELDQISASLGIRMGFIYTVLPISGALFVFYSLINIYNLWIADPEEPL
ncbi:TRAP transporter small permease [Paraglaciecola arctica]|uniref:TRAP transporter small permease protein n=1 Tax=Paraglaciecola arctica BSs20135 TaxID=493475 RepID=K6YDL8_9ALTE|nr:TRAP transporter small permease [Paraglaciecola arctica]GAC22056.1 ribosomal protein S3 [Paraglaciecola arctica BSs20135]